MDVESTPLTREEVSEILAAFPMPDAIVGTKVAGQTDWCRAEGRSLDHELWVVRTEGKRSGGRDPTYTLAFNAVVDLGGVTLAEDRFLRDVLTRKLVCLTVLNRACRRRYNAKGLSRLCLSFDWQVRHRLSLGVERNADLTPQHFNDHLTRLRDQGIAHLVPLESRIHDLAERDRAGCDGEGPDVRPKLGLHQVACELGITANAPGLRALLVAALGNRIASAAAPVERAARKQKQAGQSVRAMRLNIQPWVVLADLSQQGLLKHDPLGFDPFADQRESAALVAARNGRSSSRLAIAPAYFLKVMRAAAIWVTEYSGPILKAVTIMREDPALHGTKNGRSRPIRLAKSEAFDRYLPDGMPRLLLSWARPIRRDCEPAGARISLNTAVSHLMTACFTVIAGLSARSMEETLGLKRGCVNERGKSGLFELSIYAAGMSRNFDAMPVPAIVAAAVSVLERLTARTRSKTAEEYLFRYVRDYVSRNGGETFVFFPKRNYLQDFAAISGIPATDPETFASLSGPQLKLGFATAYHFVVPGAPTDALSRCLGQYDPEVTRRYVYGTLAGHVGSLKRRIDAAVATHRAASGDGHLEEMRTLLRDLEARQGVFERVRCEALVARAQGILAGVDVPGGNGGRKLVEDLGELSREIQTRVRLGGRNDPDAAKGPLMATLQEFARKRQLNPVPGGGAYCTCRPHDPSDLAQAECEKRRLAEARPWLGAVGADASDGLPNYAHADLSACYGCVFAAVFADNRRVGEKECERLSHAVRYAAEQDRRVFLEAKLAELRSKLAAVAPGDLS